MVKVALNKKVKKAKSKTLKFIIDCKTTVEDNVISLENFAKFMKENIKNEGKKNNLGEKITVTTEGTNIVVTSKDKLSKRYLKYLSKKYLKKQEMRDYLRVLADGKNAYKLKYFEVNQGEEEAE